MDKGNTNNKCMNCNSQGNTCNIIFRDTLDIEQYNADFLKEVWLVECGKYGFYREIGILEDGEMIDIEIEEDEDFVNGN